MSALYSSVHLSNDVWYPNIQCMQHMEAMLHKLLQLGSCNLPDESKVNGFVSSGLVMKPFIEIALYTVSTNQILVHIGGENMSCFVYSYEPELFPGLIYRMVKPRIVLLIFVSGKVVLTGECYSVVCCCVWKTDSRTSFQTTITVTSDDWHCPHGTWITVHNSMMFCLSACSVTATDEQLWHSLVTGNHAVVAEGCSTVLSSKWGQCHVYRPGGMWLNTDWCYKKLAVILINNCGLLMLVSLSVHVISLCVCV